MRWLERRRPSLRDRPWVPIAEAADGAHVRVVGRVVSRGESLEGPLSGRDCVLWSIAIDELWNVTQVRASAKIAPSGRVFRAHEWRQRLVDQKVVPFSLEDSTGRADVEVRSLVGWLERDHMRRTRPLLTAPALTRVLEGYDAPHAPLRQKSGALRVSEGVLRLGDEIAVQGHALWIDVEPSHDARGYRAPGRVRRLVLGPGDDDPVTVTNDPSSTY